MEWNRCFHLLFPLFLRAFIPLHSFNRFLSSFLCPKHVSNEEAAVGYGTYTRTLIRIIRSTHLRPSAGLSLKVAQHVLHTSLLYECPLCFVGLQNAVSFSLSMAVKWPRTKRQRDLKKRPQPTSTTVPQLHALYV